MNSPLRSVISAKSAQSLSFLDRHGALPVIHHHVVCAMSRLSTVSQSEETRRQTKSAQPPVVKQALVHASSVLTTRDRAKQEVLSIDMRPLVIHLLVGLEQAGIERVVCTLGHSAAEVAACVLEYGFRLKVDFVWLTLGTAGSTWRNLANSILASRAAFPGNEPLLIVRADQLYDWRLLSKIARQPFADGIEAYALVDVSPATLGWADGQFCQRGCSRGQCHALAKVLRGPNGRVVRCGHQLGSYDAVIAGAQLARQLASSRPSQPSPKTT